MTHRHAFEAVSRLFQDIMGAIDTSLETAPFGGKLVVLGGDFRQILPIVKRADMAVTVGACLNRSPLWEDIQCFRLTVNMRVQSLSGIHDR